MIFHGHISQSTESVHDLTVTDAELKNIDFMKTVLAVGRSFRRERQKAAAPILGSHFYWPEARYVRNSKGPIIDTRRHYRCAGNLPLAR